MEGKAMLDVLERILEKSHVAVLSTVDGDGRPRSRWMTPAVVRGRRGFLYTVSAPHFEKIEQIQKNSSVSWLLQTRALDEVLEVVGKAQIIDNPALKSEVLEAIGGHLTTFWRVNPDETELIVIETVIDELTYLEPMKGEKVRSTLE
ncbi:MAG: pyridoxamine 5'-phosphate oxidase family protein [Alkalispirochaetaceae bacterium]